MLASVDERGSAYLPLVNAFFVHEFQMMHAAEDATRFLHQACQGLPQRLRERNSDGDAADVAAARPRQTADDFYARVIEYAVAYFGSRILYPSRPAPEDSSPLSRAACEKAAQAATRGDRSKFEASAAGVGLPHRKPALRRLSRRQSRSQRPATPVSDSPRRAGDCPQGLCYRDRQTPLLLQHESAFGSRLNSRSPPEC